MRAQFVLSAACAALGLGLLSRPSPAAEPAPPDWTAKLPANKWTKLDDEKGRGGGARYGAAVVWLAEERKFLVAGGLWFNVNDDPVKMPRVYDVQTFDPAAQAWENLFPKDKEAAWRGQDGASKAPAGFPGNWDQLKIKDSEGNLRLANVPIADKFAFDPVAKQLYVVFTSNPNNGEDRGFKPMVLRRDMGVRAWESMPLPPLPVKGTYGCGAGGEAFNGVRGARMLLDPVNREILQLGGRCPGAAKGTIGDWALSVDSKQWRKMEFPSAILDPLREKALAAVRLAHDGENAGRNTWFAGMEPARESEAVKGRPAQLMADAIKLAEELSAGLGAAKAEGAEQEALAAARPLAEKALAGLKGAQAGFAGGQVSAALIRSAFDAAWALDEAAACLATSPPPRTDPAVAYNPDAKSIVLFGGDHGDYLTNDTWTYDCARKSWRQVFGKAAPPPRADAKLIWLPARKRMVSFGGVTAGERFVACGVDTRPTPDMWEFDPASGNWAYLGPATLDNAGLPQNSQWEIGSAMAAGDGDAILGLASRVVKYTPVSCHIMNRDGAVYLLRPGAADAAAKLAVSSGRRTYLSVCQKYDPTWYDAAPRGNPQEVKAFLDGLKPNVWTELPRPSHLPGDRNWGTAVLNPEMDEAYYWTGGHEADDSDLVHTYHLATNRWSIGYVADFFRGGMGATKGMSFSGRPDCANHTYINYAWDPVTRRMINSSTGGTCVFNPERGDYDLRSVSPFGHDNYTAKAVSTPRGVVFWTPSYFGLFDAKTGKHERLAVKGRLPAPDHDGTSVCYDPKRDVIWMVTWAPTLGQAWRYDMKTGLVEGMNPAGQKAFVAAKVFDGFRETAYLPKPDLVLFNNFAGPSARQVAYDPEKNRWVTLAISRGKNSSNALGHVAVGYVYDARRDLVWGIGNRNLNFVLKVDPATLDISEDPAR